MLNMVAVSANKKLRKRLMDNSWQTPGDKIASMFSMIFMYGMMIFTIWVPLDFGTPWFYTGLSVFAITLICNVVTLHNYATTPENEVIAKGMYRISRNPQYLLFSIMFFALILASMSLPLLLIWIIYNICTHFLILGEERYCREHYGESYQTYYQKVPRYFLLF